MNSSEYLESLLYVCRPKVIKLSSSPFLLTHDTWKKTLQQNISKFHIILVFETSEPKKHTNIKYNMIPNSFVRNFVLVLQNIRIAEKKDEKFRSHKMKQEIHSYSVQWMWRKTCMKNRVKMQNSNIERYVATILQILNSIFFFTEFSESNFSRHFRFSFLLFTNSNIFP